MGRDTGRVKKYIVCLSNDERTGPEKIIRTGRDFAGRLLKAWILLKADISVVRLLDGRIGEAFE